MTDGRRRWICESGQRSNSNVCSWSVAAVILGSALMGCAPFQKALVKDDAVRVRQLERNLNRQRQIIETLKERNWVLEKRVKVTAPLSSVQPPAAPAAAPVTRQIARPAAKSPDAAPKGGQSMSAGGPQRPRTLPPKLSPADVPSARTPTESVVAEKSDMKTDLRESVTDMPTGEHLLYSKILETYRSRNLAEMEKTIQLMVKTYPQSVFADNSFYMAGLLAGELGLLPRAHQLLDRVIRDFPHGNKVVSSIFAKAAFLRKEAKWEEARRHLKEVARRFPGSPESLRVSLELKLLDLEKKRHSTAPRTGQGA